MKINKNFIVVLCAFIGFFVSLSNSVKAEDAPTNFRFRYSGSAIFSVPTGKCSSSVSYINDDSNSYGFVSQSLGEILEVSILRRFNGTKKNTNTINGKLAIFSEGRVIPALCIGAADINTQLGRRIYYTAATKTFDDFGFSIHAGLCKDPIDNDKKAFFGLQKVILPLLTVAAERYDKIDTYGVKISPYPGVSLDIAQRDGKDEIFNLVYSRSY